MTPGTLLIDHMNLRHAQARARDGVPSPKMAVGEYVLHICAILRDVLGCAPQSEVSASTRFSVHSTERINVHLTIRRDTTWIHERECCPRRFHPGPRRSRSPGGVAIPTRRHIRKALRGSPHALHRAVQRNARPLETRNRTVLTNLDQFQVVIVAQTVAHRT